MSQVSVSPPGPGEVGWRGRAERGFSRPCLPSFPGRAFPPRLGFQRPVSAVPPRCLRVWTALSHFLPRLTCVGSRAAPTLGEASGLVAVCAGRAVRHRRAGLCPCRQCHPTAAATTICIARLCRQCYCDHLCLWLACVGHSKSCLLALLPCVSYPSCQGHSLHVLAL